MYSSKFINHHTSARKGLSFRTLFSKSLFTLFALLVLFSAPGYLQAKDERSYMGLLFGSSSNARFLYTSESSEFDGTENNADIGLVFGYSLDEQFDIEVRLMRPGSLIPGLDEGIDGSTPPERNDFIFTNQFLTEVGLVYRFTDRTCRSGANCSNFLFNRRLLSPFVRLGFGTISNESLFFESDSEPRGFASAGLGLDINSGGTLGARFEVHALTANVVSANFSLIMRYF